MIAHKTDESFLGALKTRDKTTQRFRNLEKRLLKPKEN
jgi:hypothetical protein